MIKEMLELKDAPMTPFTTDFFLSSCASNAYLPGNSISKIYANNPTSLWQFGSFYDENTTDTQLFTMFSRDCKNVLISFRGTQEKWDFVRDLGAIFPYIDLPGIGRVNPTPYNGWVSVRHAVQRELESRVYPGSLIFVTGHSLGASTAIVSAMDLEAWGYLVYVVSFGAFTVGDPQYIKTLQEKSNKPDSKIHLKNYLGLYDPVIKPANAILTSSYWPTPQAPNPSTIDIHTGLSHSISQYSEAIRSKRKDYIPLGIRLKPIRKLHIITQTEQEQEAKSGDPQLEVIIRNRNGDRTGSLGFLNKATRINSPNPDLRCFGYAAIETFELDITTKFTSICIADIVETGLGLIPSNSDKLWSKWKLSSVGLCVDGFPVGIQPEVHSFRYPNSHQEVSFEYDEVPDLNSFITWDNNGVIGNPDGTWRKQIYGNGRLLSGIEVRNEDGYGIVNARGRYNRFGEHKPTDWTCTDQGGIEKISYGGDDYIIAVQVKEQDRYGIIDLRVMYKYCGWTDWLVKNPAPIVKTYTYTAKDGYAIAGLQGSYQDNLVTKWGLVDIKFGVIKVDIM